MIHFLVQDIADGMNNPIPIISGSNGTVKTYKFELCPPRFKEYIPCLDNVAAINKLEATNRGEAWERRCPSQRSRMCCLIATPLNYRLPIRWPKSRDEVGGYFVPHLSICVAALFECVSMSELTITGVIYGEEPHLPSGR